MLPLEAPLRLIGGTTDFKLYNFLCVNDVYNCIIVVLSLGNFLSIRFFLSFIYKIKEHIKNIYLEIFFRSILNSFHIYLFSGNELKIRGTHKFITSHETKDKKSYEDIMK